MADPPPGGRTKAPDHGRGRAVSTPTHYELCLAGHLDEHWSAWLGGLTLTRETDGTTTLRGIVTDQAELHGLLAKVRDLGATLISINPTDAPHPGAATTPSTPANLIARPTSPAHPTAGPRQPTRSNPWPSPPPRRMSP
jgi:hypothetical protein